MDWKMKLAGLIAVGSLLCMAIGAGLEKRAQRKEFQFPTVEQPAYGGKLAGNYGQYLFRTENVWKCLDEDCAEEGYMTRVTVTTPNTILKKDFEQCTDKGNCSFEITTPFQFTIYIDPYWRIEILTENGFDIYEGEFVIDPHRLGGKVCSGEFIVRYPTDYESREE